MEFREGPVERDVEKVGGGKRAKYDYIALHSCIKSSRINKKIQKKISERKVKQNKAVVYIYLTRSFYSDHFQC